MPPLVMVAAALLGLVPALWLLAVRAAGRRPETAWWWMAWAFAVSAVADVASLVMTHPIVSQTYPVTQAALFLLVLLPRERAVAIVAGLFTVGAGSLWLRHGEGMDFPLHAVAWGSVAVAAWHVLRPGWLRAALGGGFAALVVAWAGFVLAPGWWTWGGLQAVRAGQAAAFVVAAWQGTSTRGGAHG